MLMDFLAYNKLSASSELASALIKQHSRNNSRHVSQKELRYEVGEMDICAMVQRMSALQIYCDAIEKGGLGHEQRELFAKLRAVQESICQQKQKVSDLIVSFISCIREGDPALPGELKSILNKALRQSSSAEARQLYDEWVQQLGQQLLDLHHGQSEVLADEHADVGHCIRVYRALEDQWKGWLADHLRSFSPCRNLNLSEAECTEDVKRQRHDEQVTKASQSDQE